MNRYIIGILALFGLAILLILLLFTGSPKKTAPPAQTPKFSSYVTSESEVKMVVNGPVVAPEKHNSAVISVTAKSATFNLIQGYDGQVISSKVLNNSQNSYKNFMYSLYYAGYTKGTTDPNYTTDTGLCATGNTYDFYLYDNGDTVQHYWATNCAKSPLTYLGNLSSTVDLFEAQIPDIGILAQNSNITGL